MPREFRRPAPSNQDERGTGPHRGVVDNRELFPYHGCHRRNQFQNALAQKLRMLHPVAGPFLNCAGSRTDFDFGTGCFEGLFSSPGSRDGLSGAAN